MDDRPYSKAARRARRALARAREALEWLLLVTALGGAAGAIAWLVRHYG